MAQEIGVPLNKLSTIISQFRDIAVPAPAPAPTPVAAPVAESKVITKSELINSINKKNVIKTVKIKDIK